VRLDDAVAVRDVCDDLGPGLHSQPISLDRRHRRMPAPHVESAQALLSQWIDLLAMVAVLGPLLW